MLLEMIIGREKKRSAAWLVAQRGPGVIWSLPYSGAF